MTQQQLIAMVDEPVTVELLSSQLRDLGVRSGMTLLVHSSLSSIGWVCGGADAVVRALLDSVGESGNLVMPTHTSNRTDPALWTAPPVPKSWWPIIRDSIPPFDPRTSTTYQMGAVAEAFRSYPDVHRSNHPHVSFAARGPNAKVMVRDHSLNDGLGRQSPLARIYDTDGYVLLIGVGHDRNTSIHLAERIAFGTSIGMQRNGASMIVDGCHQWVAFDEPRESELDFGAIGSDFQKDSHSLRRGNMGVASVELMSQIELVDFSADWIRKRHRLS